jgi:pyridinium-3,5-bisthiocarboxylic acid mononucleotide nickel chelatase
MKIAYLDCFSGISGDMTLSALVACGVPVPYLKSEIKKLGLRKYNINFSSTIKNNISAQKVDIEFDESEQPVRTYTNIIKIISDSHLEEAVKNKSIEAFTVLGKAESKIHGIEIEKIHFHEVGAVDSIIDLVGSIIGFDSLGVEKIYTSAIPLGTGFATTEHGTMPVPSPAALEILKDYPIAHRNAGFEMTTPTGATLVKTLSDGIMPDHLVFSPTEVGFGAGTKTTKDWPNVLRLVVGETEDEAKSERLVMLEAQIDDLNPEIYPFLMEKVLDLGAKDIFLTPVIMKKGRPGTKVSIISEPSHVNQLERILFTETTTIGIRKYPIERTILERTSETIITRFGKMVIKKVLFEDKELIRPEYEECKRIALEKNLSIQQIYREIESLNK